ncbi:MAG TPA: hypothetical protein GX714_05875 [Chloroflexi bacterium]|jgi:hypothetical protein|nr:hypothetical protein [Chloroflexota bacterium]
MDYGRIFRRALGIMWRHKVLWLFGIAAALFSSGYGSGNASSVAQYRMDQGDLGALGRMFPFGADFSRAIPIILAIIGAVLLFAIVLWIVGIIVRYTSLGALIGGVDEVERTEDTTFRSSLNRGWRNLLPLFAIDLLISLATSVVVIAIILLAIAGGAFALVPAIVLAGNGGSNAVAILWGLGVGLIVLVGIIAVSIIVSAIVTLVRELAFRARILENQGVFDALGGAFRLIRSRLKEVLIVWLLLVAIDLALSVLFIPIAIIGAVGLVSPVLAALAITESVAVALIIGLPLLLFFILVTAVFGGIYLTYRSTVWTLAYRELRSDHLVAEAV